VQLKFKQVAALVGVAPWDDIACQFFLAHVVFGGLGFGPVVGILRYAASSG
jgi:hypothetical protein